MCEGCVDMLIAIVNIQCSAPNLSLCWLKWSISKTICTSITTPSAYSILNWISLKHTCLKFNTVDIELAEIMQSNPNLVPRSQTHARKWPSETGSELRQTNPNPNPIPNPNCYATSQMLCNIPALCACIDGEILPDE